MTDNSDSKTRFASVADRVAKRLNADSTYDDIWDACDIATGGELDTVQMDILSESGP